MQKKKSGRGSRTGCAVETSLDLIGGRWKGVVVYWLLEGTKRYGELRRLLPNCTERMLTLQLRELEADELITRKVYAEVPPRVEYTLTELGQALGPVIGALKQWGELYQHSMNADSA